MSNHGDTDRDADDTIIDVELARAREGPAHRDARYASRVTALLAARPELRGISPLADTIEEATRWAVRGAARTGPRPPARRRSIRSWPASTSTPMRSDARDGRARLRRAREERGLSLRSLAQGIDVSPSLLSQIENGLARPSVGTLWALVDELGVSLDLLFRKAPHDGDAGTPSLAVQREGEREVIELSGGVTWEHLGAAHDPGVLFAFVTYRPGEQSGSGHEALPPARHRGGGRTATWCRAARPSSGPTRPASSRSG